MKRKIIELGHECMVVSIPKKWITKNNLSKGHELDVQEQDEKLIITPQQVQKTYEISIDITRETESNLRNLIINAYRAGYDKIKINYPGAKKQLYELIDKHLLGFELFEGEHKKYTAEAVAEPSPEEFEKLLIKQFQLISQIISHLDQNIQEEVFRVRKYDNYLKRCITKHHLFDKEKGFMWQLLSNLTQIANQCLHFQEDVKEKLDTHEQTALKEIHASFDLLQKSYLQKNAQLLETLHSPEQKKAFESAKQTLKEKKSLSAYYLLSISRTIYISSSPLEGFFQTQAFSNQN